MSVEFEDLPERLQLAMYHAAKNLPGPKGGRTDPVALHEEFQRYYRMRVVRGKKQIATTLEVSPQTVWRYLKCDLDFQSIVKKDDKGRWCAFETDLVLWSQSKQTDF